MYVYKLTETAAETGSYPLYTVGFYEPPSGLRWIPESDHGGPSGKDDAAKRVAWLNGSSGPDPMSQILNEGDGTYRP